MKTILITGANGNLGSFFLEKYVSSGKNVIALIHQNSDRIRSFKEKHRKNLQIISVDLSDFSSLKTKLAHLFRQRKWIPTMLIHTSTARSHDFKPLAESDPKLWSKIIDVNIKGTFNILKIILPVMRSQNFGRIVLFGSNVSRLGLPKGSAYAASKSAIANICRSVAAEEAKNNILMNTISPGPIKIDDSHFSESYRKFRQEYYNEKIKLIPLKRYAKFEDIMGLSNFLLSPENNYITGEEFFITGGKL